MVHTGPNTQEGGLKKGFTKVGYQVVTELKVKTEPITPASPQIKMQKIKRGTLILFTL